MNSLEGYPRYIGVDFFGCRNVWAFNLWRIRSDFFFFFFLTMKRSFWNRDIFMFKEMKRSPWTLVMFYSIYWYSDQFHLLLRKTKVCFLRLGTSCAAIFIFILHISSPYDWDLGPVLIMCDASANCIVITSCLSAWSWDFWLISVHR